MYNTSLSGKNTSHQEESSQIGYFIFVILSECDIHFRLPKSKKTSAYQIIFKPNHTSKPNYDYLSINKEQTLKAIAFDSRSDFVTWMSALRLVKYGSEELSLAYKNCLMPPAPSIGGLAGEKNCSLASNNFLPACNTANSGLSGGKAQSSFKTKAIMDLHKVKGLNQILKLKTKARTRESSLSWSESISSLSQLNSSRTSQLSLMNSDSDVSSTNSSSFMFKKPKQFSAMLSDVPHDSEPEFGTEPYEIEDCEEEPDFVPIDMSAKGGCEIITDPNLIRQIEEESAFKSKFRSIKSVPFSEPWFTKKSKSEVENLLYNNFHVDGYFLVNPDYDKENNSVVALYLSVMCSDILHQYKIIQRLLFEKCVFSLDGGYLNFPTISSLVEFHTLNIMKPLPCYLTESPIIL